MIMARKKRKFTHPLNSNLNSVLDLYNCASSSSSSSSSNKRQKTSSPVQIHNDVKPLRRFHNRVKKNLLSYFGPRRIPTHTRILDLCCGRGGDIHKIIHSKYKEYYGIDLSPNEVHEAQRRASSREDNRTTSFSFSCHDLSDPNTIKNLKLESKKYNVVSCMFALHYFFKSDDILTNFFDFINDNLSQETGSVFTGIVPDGRQILKVLNKDGLYRTSVLTIEKEWPEDTKIGNGIGLTYSYSMEGTVTCVSDMGLSSLECLVFEQTLIKHAARVNLVPLKIYGNPRLFHERDRRSMFKHRRPDSYDGDLSEASRMFASFAFVRP